MQARERGLMRVEGLWPQRDLGANTPGQRVRESGAEASLSWTQPGNYVSQFSPNFIIIYPILKLNVTFEYDTVRYCVFHDVKIWRVARLVYHMEQTK